MLSILGLTWWVVQPLHSKMLSSAIVTIANYHVMAGCSDPRTFFLMHHIKLTGGLRHNKGRLWYKGEIMENGCFEEFDDDCINPIKDLIMESSHRQNQHDAQFAYSYDDIDTLSNQLGIPWEKEKDTPFSTKVVFIGFEWDFQNLTVSIPLDKRQKYLSAIEEWTGSRTHTLEEARKLHGKLLHASLILTYGCPYLIRLESFLGVFRDNPFKPHTPQAQLQEDLRWWRDALAAIIVERPIPGRSPVTDLEAYSDASSEVGIGVTMGNHWRAWRLIPGWNTGEKDIGWAEAVGFYLLIAIITNAHRSGGHYRVFGDNQGVVEGWWRGRSRNKPTNEIFKRIGELAQHTNSTIYTKYVPSKDNPADNPSRGRYSSLSLLLPAPTIPDFLTSFVVDFDHPLLPVERELASRNKLPLPKPKPPHTTDPSLTYEELTQFEVHSAEKKTWW